MALPNILKTNPRLTKGLVVAFIFVVVYLSCVIYRWSHTESTDNAYVEADISNVSSEVDGVIAEVLVQDNSPVQVGQVIAKIDRTNSLAYYEKAAAELDNAERQVEVIAQDIVLIKIEQTKNQEEFEFAERNFMINQADYTRTQKLSKDNYASRKRLDETEIAFEKAKNSYSQAKLNINTIAGKLTLLEIQKLAAVAKLNAAIQEKALKQRALDKTEIRAPINGILGNSALKVGNYIRTGVPLCSIVPIDQLYVKANFKETQIKKFTAGTSATIIFDSTNNRVTGKIRNLSPATGSKFSLLPSNNATGNFTKIVQRVPVLIDFTIPDDFKGRIVPGMSVTVEVNH